MLYLPPSQKQDIARSEGGSSTMTSWSCGDRYGVELFYTDTVISRERKKQTRRMKRTGDSNAKMMFDDCRVLVSNLGSDVDADRHVTNKEIWLSCATYNNNIEVQKRASQGCQSIMYCIGKKYSTNSTGQL